jgi:hypothetical protein
LPMDIEPGDIALMRKPHPCGGLEWEITGIGADIRLKCLTCGRRVIIDRETFARRARSTRKPDEHARSG